MYNAFFDQKVALKPQLKHIIALLLVTFALFLAGQNKLMAQDPVFSQFPALPMQINPALAGNETQGEFTVIFRDQWPELAHTYINYALAWSQFFPDLQSGFGLMLMGDQQAGGLMATHSVHGYYVFAIPLGRNLAIRSGIELNWANRRLDWESLRFFDQIDPIFGLNDPLGNPNPTGEIAPFREGVNWFDASAGLVLFSDRFYAGLSLKHLPRPDASIFDADEDLLPRQFTVMAGANLEFGSGRNDKAWIAPHLIYARQADYQQIKGGFRIGKGAVLGGMGLRHAWTNIDAVELMVGLKKGLFSMNYGYDIPIGPIGTESGGAHEIALKFKVEGGNGKQQQRKSQENLRCPVF
ncbi:MAG: type IX secretion system PorP/SprF family membrane protein [Limisphaerales bacterium]|jgi:type IX secretion system PorP/SprF family membrane protein